MSYYNCNNNVCKINPQCKEESPVCIIDETTCNEICKNHVPDIHEYCKNPNVYKDRMTNEEITDYDKRCMALNGLDTIFYNVGDIFNPMKLEKIIDGLINTTSGREMLGILFGKTVITKLGPKFSTWLAKNLSKDFIESTAKTFAEKGILGIGDLSLSLIGYSFKAGLDSALFVDSWVIAPVEWVLTYPMLLGMVIDMWDPCDLRKEINSDYINQFSANYNDAFMVIINNINSPKEDLQQKLLYRLNTWPQEYYLDNTEVADAVKELDLEKKYAEDFTVYMGTYLSNMKDIKIDKDPTHVITTEDIAKLNGTSKDMLYNISGQNTVVEKFIKKYWPFIALLIFLFFFLIIIFISKK
jgi:hypothetical protein